MKQAEATPLVGVYECVCLQWSITDSCTIKPYLAQPC